MALINRVIGRVQGNSIRVSQTALIESPNNELKGYIETSDITPLINDLIIDIGTYNIYKIIRVSQDDTPNVYVVYTNNTPLLNIKGPQGNVGPKGDTGAQGPKGDTGPQGPIGPEADINISIGEVSTLPAGQSATASITETSSNNFTLNLGLPRGDTGEGSVGPQGPKGETGETGPQGPAGENGKTPTMSLSNGDLIATFN